MRVLTFLHSFEPGGVERDALRLNDEWARLGVDVQIALGRTDGRLAEEAPDLPYHVFQHPGDRSTAHFETLYMIWRLPALIRALHPDVLFCAGNTYTIVAVAMRLLLGRKCPPIVLRISNDLERRDLPLPIRTAYHLWVRGQAWAFAAVVGMMEPVRAEIARRFGIAADRVIIIDNGCFRAEDMHRLAVARDATTRDHAGRAFLAVGRLALQKNFALLLRAFARIAKADDRLTIVGEGGQRATLESLAARLGIADRVALPGHVHPVEPCFAQADAFVLSSDYEGLGVVVIEALAAGVPIVATDCCAAMPSLVAGVGRLVPTRDPAALANAMDTIIDDSVSGAVHVPASRERASRFTVEAAAPQWLALFARL